MTFTTMDWIMFGAGCFGIIGWCICKVIRASQELRKDKV